jgi:hypothetical protein
MATKKEINMKRASALVVMLSILGFLAVQGCERSAGDQLSSDVKEAGRDMKRGVQDAVD